MEYSVGSLADLITGQNTPNKPKVVKKEFKQIVIKSESDSENEISSPKKQKMKKSLSKLQNGKSPQIKTPKSEKKSKSPKIEKATKSPKLEKEGNSPITPAKSPKKDKSPKKSLKRKLDTSNASDLADSDAEEQEPSPKKTKTSLNETNAERRVKKKIKKENQANPEYKEKTIFVGNIPITAKKIKIKKHFKKYGPIDTVRVRGIPVKDPKVSKKVAAIKKEFHPDRHTVYAYIRFVNKEDAEKAVAENGSIFMENHIRVHLCESTDKPDESKAIFVGNLSFDAEEEDLWKVFQPCGAISHVRIVRDSSTGMGKGFGYVNFEESDSVQLALEMENVKLKDRELRISLCNLNMAKKNKKNNKNKQIKKSGKPKFRPRSRFSKNAKEGEGKPDDAKKPFVAKNSKFQGTQFNEKKKKKNNADREKKKLIAKFTPKNAKSD